MNIKINKIGLEAEFLLRNKDGQLVYPSRYGFGTDEFLILGEFRGAPGETRAKTIANFLEEYYAILYKAKKENLTVDIVKGFDEVDPKFYSEILRQMGTKVVAHCKNIYDTDILALNDSVIENGKIVKRKLSLGLHIHFSSENVSSEEIKEIKYRSVKLPLNISGAESSLDLYAKESETTRKIEVKVSGITKPVVKHIVSKLDTDILPKTIADLPPLKYRNPGFYEMKSWGFEYRSLPFNKLVLDDIANIVDYSFTLLEGL